MNTPGSKGMILMELGAILGEKRGTEPLVFGFSFEIKRDSLARRHTLKPLAACYRPRGFVPYRVWITHRLSNPFSIRNF